jgi:hypothetical protein
MDDIVGRVPIFVTQASRDVVFGPQRTKGVCARFLIDPDRPDYVAVCTAGFILWLSRDALTDGLSIRTLEPSGDISIRPYEAEEVTWLVIDIDRPAFPAAQISARLEVVSDYLFMADALLTLVDGRFERLVKLLTAGADVEREWPLRSEGGAA